MTPKERKDRFDALSELGCAVCGQPPQIHHLTGLKYRGMGQKAGDECTIPLCMNHHTGQQGIHSIGKRQWEADYGTQEELLEITNVKIEMLRQIQQHGYFDVESFDKNNQ
jgi:hypothetical protein